MKRLLRSTFGTLTVATFLAIAPPMYARGGHGGHGGSGHFARGHGHAMAHAARGHAGFVRGGHGQRFVGHGRGNARFAGRAFRAGRGGWGGSYWYPSSGYSRFGYYGWGWGYPYYGAYGYPSRW